jgi:hypothetical protein
MKTYTPPAFMKNSKAGGNTRTTSRIFGVVNKWKQKDLQQITITGLFIRESTNLGLIL